MFAYICPLTYLHKYLVSSLALLSCLAFKKIKTIRM